MAGRLRSEPEITMDMLSAYYTTLSDDVDFAQEVLDLARGLSPSLNPAELGTDERRRVRAFAQKWRLPPVTGERDVLTSCWQWATVEKRKDQPRLVPSGGAYLRSAKTSTEIHPPHPEPFT